MDSQARASGLLFWLAFLVPCAAAFLLFAANPRIQDFELNADQLTVPILAEELLRNPRFEIAAWAFPAAPLIADTILYVPLRALVGAPLPAILAFGIVHFALLIGGVALLIRRAFDDLRRQHLATVAAAILALGFAFGATVDWRVFAWPFLPLAHSGALVAAIFAYLAYERARRGSAGWEAAGAVLSFIGALSDSLFVPFFSAPYFALLLAGAGEDRAARFRCLRFAVVQAAAWLLARWLLSFTPSSDLGLPMPHLLVRIAALAAAYWKGGALVVVCCLVAMALTYGTLGAHLLRWWRIGWRTFLTPFERTTGYLALAAAFNILAVAIIWSGENLFNGKYAPAFQLFPPLIGVFLLARRLPARALRRARQGMTGLAALGVALTAIALPAADIGRLFGRQLVPEAALECLDEAGLGSGLAGYWEARPLTLASGWRHQVDPLFPGSATPFVHGNNALSFRREMLTGEPVRYGFVITNGADEGTLIRAFGAPDGKRSCGPYNLLVYTDTVRLTETVQAMRPLVFGCAACEVSLRPDAE